MPNELDFSQPAAITVTQLLLPKPIINQEYPNLTKYDI